LNKIYLLINYKIHFNSKYEVVDCVNDYIVFTIYQNNYTVF